jgi:hypothetical protein
VLFFMCLASGFRWRHPDEMLADLPSRWYTDWLTYYNVEPFDHQRTDLQAGIIASTICNRWRGKGEAPRAPYDYMPFIVKWQSPEEIKSRLESILASVNDGTRRSDKHRLGGEDGKTP